jgi:hypothetical protein
VKGDAIEAAHAERREVVDVIQPSELAFHGRAASVERPEPLGMAGDVREQPCGLHARDPTPLEATARLRRRDLLGGFIHEYEAA